MLNPNNARFERGFLGTLLVAAALFVVWLKPFTQAPVVFKNPEPVINSTPLWQERMLDRADAAMVHASFIEPLPDGRVLAFWFGGTREGHRDVQIYRAVLKDGELLSAPEPVLSSYELTELSSRFVKKVGNPVVLMANGQLHMWVVNVSVGGWATAKVDQLVSNDEGRTFEFVQTLPTSPFLNISTLVKNKPIAIEGGWVIPAYFELNRLDPMYLVFDENLRFQRADTQIMGAIQPELVPLSTNKAAVFARPWEQREVQRAFWPERSAVTGIDTLPNDSSPVSVLCTGASELLMVHNGGDGRGQLYLSTSSDEGQTWLRVKTLEDEPGARFSYPTMVLGTDGYVHLSYTYKREAIKYVRFSWPLMNDGEGA